MKPIRTLTPFKVTGPPTVDDDDGADKIDAAIKPHYEAYKANPLPSLADAYLGAVRPIIDAGVAASGAPSSPLLHSRAKKIILDATPGYDPTKGALKPYLSSHLQRLKRYGAERRQILSVPERVAMESTALTDAESELADRLGRPPSTAELADQTGISRDRIGYVRGYRPGVTEGQVTGHVGLGGEEMSDGPAVEQADTTPAKLSYIYDDLDPVDQAIVEHRYGLHGRPRMPVAALAAKFGLSPGAISQRAGRIAAKLDEIDDTGLF